MKSLRVFLLLSLFIFPNVSFSQQNVTVTNTGNEVVLTNEYIRATINKRKALISSIKYNGQELIGKPHTNWNIVGNNEDEGILRKFPEKAEYSICINPLANNGERAEVSFRYKYAGDTTSTPVDVDLRFALGRKDKGIYLSALFHHAAGYPAFSIGQGRMIVTLNPKIFDFYTVDKNRRRQMATSFDVKNGLRRNVKEANLLTTGIHKGEVEHKYDYAAILAQTPAWGWTSTQKHVGVWIINPSAEYINGGPTQVGNTGHVETQLLNHWQDGHYGGEALNFRENEEWSKFIGPFYLYCNSAASHDEMWADALREAESQQNSWPFAWEQHKNYLKKSERGTLSGQIMVSEANFTNMWVGLAVANDGNNEVNWQYESKNYQFWTRADENGKFLLQNIRPGNYTLYAFADGILGELKKTNVTINAGNNASTGNLEWKPVRYGKQLWEIGVPNRSAVEFRHGNDYWHWGLYMLYPKEFPNDVNFTIGKSDWSKDWNYCQPMVIGEDYKVIRGTQWSVFFNIPQKMNGKATLRIAVCGSRDGEQVKVSLNDQYIGSTGHLPHMGVMHRDGIRGKEEEINIPFDAALLKAGTNCLKLSLNAKNWTFGVLYDYLRLEVEENKQ